MSLHRQSMYEYEFQVANPLFSDKLDNFRKPGIFQSLSLFCNTRFRRHRQENDSRYNTSWKQLLEAGGSKGFAKHSREVKMIMGFWKSRDGKEGIPVRAFWKESAESEKYRTGFC